MTPLQGKLHDTKTGKAGAIASGKVLSTEALSEHLLQIMRGGVADQWHDTETGLGDSPTEALRASE